MLTLPEGSQGDGGRKEDLPHNRSLEPQLHPTTPESVGRGGSFHWHFEISMLNGYRNEQFIGK